MNKNGRQSNAGTVTSEGTATVQKAPRVTSLKRTLSHASTILNALRKLRRANYFLSLETATGDRLQWLKWEGCSALRTIVRVHLNEFGSLEDLGTDRCLQSPRAVNLDAARLAYRLHCIAIDIVFRWLEPLSTRYPKKIVALEYSDSPPSLEYPFLNLKSARSIHDFNDYLDRLDFLELDAAAEMIRAQLKDRFIPSPKQLALYEAVKSHDYLKVPRLTKDKLAAKLGVDGSDLYPKQRYGLHQLTELEFVENDPHHGYITVNELHHPLRKKKR